jgi:DedD protein
MPLPSLLRRKKSPPAPRPENTAAGAPAVVEQARTRARRRLIGAVVLLGIGVIAFPLLFETEPRPIPVDLPIEIPKRDAVPPLAMPSAAARGEAAAPAEPAPAPVAEAKVEPPPLPAPASAPESRPADKPAEKPAEKPVEKSATVASKPDDGARAKALLEGKPPAVAAEGRFVVQIGAFAEDRTVREVRAKAQKAGLATHTQPVTVSSGTVTRVRVGPFATRQEADAAAAALRKADLPATVLKL